MNFWKRAKIVLPRDMARAQLLQAQKDRLHHKCRAEYHQAMVSMFEQRITRLKEDVATLVEPVLDADELDRLSQFERQLDMLEDSRAQKDS